VSTMFNRYPKTTRHRRQAAKRPRRHAAIFAVGRVERLPGLVHCAVGEFGEVVAGEPDNRWRVLPAHEAGFSYGQKAQAARS